MHEWFKNEKNALMVIGAAALALMISTVISGCGVDDWIKVDVPLGVQQATDTEPAIPFSQSDATYEEWIAWVERNDNRFKDAIGESAKTVGVIKSLTDTGLTMLGDATATVPGGAFISTGLALVGGLLLKRPGENKKVQKEKEASYRAGIEEGEKLGEKVKEMVASIRSTGE